MKRFRLITLLGLLSFGVISQASAQVEIIQTIAGGGGSLGDGGPASAAQVNANYFMALDGTGNLYIADNGNNRIRRIDATTGIITTVAGIGGMGGFTADNVDATTSKLNSPIGIAIDAAGNLYIGDQNNNRIRKVSALGTITTIAGTGAAGTSPNGTPAVSALINQPRGVAVSTAGEVYFSEGGGTTTIVRMITTSGTIQTVAGTGAAAAAIDGVVATSSPLNNPRGVYLDATGNLYIADMNNSRIRKVDAGSHIITTVAGNGTAGYLGDGVQATATRINLPTSMRFDAAGNMYIADVSNNRIRMVTPAGIISTVAGSGTNGYAGDGSPATAAAVRLNGAVDVILTTDPNYFYISERNNSRIRLVKPNSTPYFTGGTRRSLAVCQNAAAVNIGSLIAVTDSDKSQTLTWSATLIPIHGTFNSAGTSTSNGGSVTPTGKTYTPASGYTGPDSFYVQVSDGIVTAVDTIIVNVNPLPSVGVTTGPSSVCVGSAVTLTNPTSGGTWSTLQGFATVAGGVVTGISAGTDSVIYAVSNACGTVADTFEITVNPAPDAGTITSSTLSVCTGASITLSDAAPGGTWSESNGNASVSGGVVTGINANTTDAISYTVTNGCGTAVSTVTVSVITLAGAGTSLSGPSAVCEGSSITLTSTVAGGTWSESTGNATVAGGVVTGVTPGTDVITYSLTNACGTNDLTASITINPLPVPGTISGLSSVCLGGTISLTDPAPGGTWSATNSNASVSSTGMVTGLAVGTDVISYTVSNFCGVQAATLTVNVVSTPSAGAISGTATVCAGTSTTLTDPVPGGVWTAANANATVSGGVVTGVTAGTDNITYTVTFSCGTAFTTRMVTINPLPAPAAITGAASVCVGGTTVLADAVPGGTWSVSNGNATISGAGMVTGVTAGLDTAYYAVTNTCGTVAVRFPMSVNPVVTPSVSFTATPGFTTCPGVPVTYIPSATNGGTSPAYQWKVNGTLLGTGTSFVYTPSSGDIVMVLLTSSIACVSVPVASAADTVVVNPTLAPTVHIAVGVSGDTLCIGDMATYTATGTNGGTSPVFQWNVNGLIYAFGNPFTYSPANGDVVTCDYTSSYACPVPATVTSNSVTMTVNTTEVPTVSITETPGNPVCAGQPVTFAVHSLYGGITPSYRWTKNGVNVATGPNYIYTPANGDEVYAMLASSATCRTVDAVFSNHIIMSVSSPTVMTVTITSALGVYVGVGQNDTLHAVVTGVPSPTYQWYVNGSAVPGATSSYYIVNSTTVGTEVINCVAGSGDACATTAVSNNLSLSVTGVGVKQLGMAQGTMDIHPNPSNGHFTLQLTAQRTETVQVTITNTVGEKVSELTTMTNQAADISIAQPGIYFVTAVTAQDRYVTRVVVE